MDDPILKELAYDISCGLLSDISAEEQEHREDAQILLDGVERGTVSLENVREFCAQHNLVWHHNLASDILDIINGEIVFLNLIDVAKVLLQEADWLGVGRLALSLLSLARERTPEGRALEQSLILQGQVVGKVGSATLTSGGGFKALDDRPAEFWSTYIRAYLERPNPEEALAGLPEGLEQLLYARPMTRMAYDLGFLRAVTRSKGGTQENALEALKRIETMLRTSLAVSYSAADHLTSIKSSVGRVESSLRSFGDLVLESLSVLERQDRLLDGEQLLSIRDGLAVAWLKNYQERAREALMTSAARLVGGRCWDLLAQESRDDLAMIVALREEPGVEGQRGELLLLFVLFERELGRAIERNDMTPAVGLKEKLQQGRDRGDPALAAVSKVALEYGIAQIRNELAHGRAGLAQSGIVSRLLPGVPGASSLICDVVKAGRRAGS